MKEKIYAIRRFIRFCIADTIWVLRYYEKLKLELAKYSIVDVALYKFARWHSGFYYFTGCKNGVRVFIKLCCGEWDTIPTEAYLDKYTSFKEHPVIMDYQLKPFSWIATEFISTRALNDLHRVIDIKKLVQQMVLILDEMNDLGIIHRDLRPENICLDDNDNVLLIDFGWAIFKDKKWEKTKYRFIENILNQEYRNEAGQFDDALSVYLSFKAAFPGITDEEMKPIIERIGRLTA